jgi:hypothetical protein
VSLVLVSRRCRITLDTQRYSVPPRFANPTLTLKAYPDRLRLSPLEQLKAEHPRS